MKRAVTQGGCALLVLILLMGQTMGAGQTAAGETDSIRSATATYLCTTVKEPSVSSVGGEWTVLGLARSEYEVPEDYFDNYYRAVEDYVTAYGGILHTRKYTEYSRVILALTAIGKDPANVVGYNLLTPLGDYDKTVWQGINGPIWALIALDCGGYPMPQNPDATTQATREMYVDRILSRQLTDGGFSLAGTGSADLCLTAMALQALAGYTQRSDVAASVDRALACLSGLQNQSGGFGTDGAADSESCAQTIIALCELGVSVQDERFVKNGHTLVDNLLSFQVEGGGFAHTSADSVPNLMATEQAMLALTALYRATTVQSGLYDIVLTMEQSGSTWSTDARRQNLAFYYWNNAPVWSNTK